jgi:uncharacterized membrane protein
VPQLLLGLVLFLGMHSVSIVALPLRDRIAARIGVGWKAFYAIISIIGIVLIAKGYADLRQAPSVLYVPPIGLRHVAAVLMLPTFVLLFAPFFPGRIKRASKHPQLIAVKLWALSHLMMNGNIEDVLLFGSFLLWAVANRVSMKNRVGRPLPGVPESRMNDVILIVIGLAFYAAFIFWLHELLLGVRPFAISV